MDWFLYDNGLRHERVNYIVLVFIEYFDGFVAFYFRL